MPVSRRSLSRSLALLFLILCHTKMVVQAQAAALNSSHSNSSSTKDIADALSRAFGAAASQITGSASEAVPDTASSPTSIENTTRMAQSADPADGTGAGLKLLDAYSTLLNSVQVNDIGSGANLQRLQDAAKKIQTAYKAVSGVVGPDALSAGLGRIINAEQLLLKTIGTGLGDFGLVAVGLAIAAYISVIVGGALLTAGSSVLLAVNLQALGAASAQAASTAATGSAYPGMVYGAVSGSPNGTEWWHSPGFQTLSNSSGTMDPGTSRIINWAFDTSGNNAIEQALAMIDTAESLLQPNAQ